MNTRLDWDDGLGRDPRDFRLHQSHPAARGAGEVAGRSLRHAAAAASRDHLRDQPPLPRRSPRRLSPATTPGLRGCRSSMKAGRATCAWPISPCVGSHTINGVARLHSELLKQTVLRDFAELVAGEILQRDQWRHAAPVRRREQSRPDAAHHHTHRRRLAARSDTGCAHSSRWPTTRSSSSSGAT